MPGSKVLKKSVSKCPPCSYSSEFRCRIYQINPYDLSCMYKLMFEACAVNSLFEIDNNYKSGKICKDKFKLFCPSSPSGPDSQKRPTPHIMRTESILKSILHDKDVIIDGWRSCQYPHIAPSTDIIKTCSSKKETRGKLISKSDSFPTSKEECTRNAKTMRRATTTGGLSRIDSKIQYGFHHYDDMADYMVQYRQDYTYRQLEMLHLPFMECGGPSQGIQRLNIYDGKQTVSAPTSPPSSRTESSSCSENTLMSLEIEDPLTLPPPPVCKAKTFLEECPLLNNNKFPSRLFWKNPSVPPSKLRGKFFPACKDGRSSRQKMYK